MRRTRRIFNTRFRGSSKPGFGAVRLRCLIILAAWAVSLAPGQAVAGKLVMDVSGRTELLSGRVRVILAVTNRGDEPALNIRAEAPGVFPIPKSLTAERLDPGRTIELALRLDDSGLKPGTYVKVILVNFRDLKGHPFTAPAEVRFHLGPEVTSLVKALAAPVRISDRGSVVIQLLNQGQEPLDLKINVFTPKEFSAAKPENPVRLLPGRSRSVSFDLWNLSGIAGSAYPVMVLLEHDIRGRHTAQVVRVRAVLTGRRNIILAHLEWWLAAIGVLSGMVILAQFRTGGRT